MSGSTGVDHCKEYYSSQPRGFLTPPPTWKTRRSSPVMPGSEKKPRRSPQPKADLFHVIHKVPSGDSPYVRAKHVQLIDKDPSRAISMFWAAINSGDRVDSALKDMAVVMKQLDRPDEAIEAIKSFRHLCPPESQESLDNILVELYKQSGRIEEEIEMLQLKLKQVEEGIAFAGKKTKMARSQGKKIQITVEKEYSRLLGNLAWAFMQQKDFKSAEEHYRKALSFESDKNKQCNLAVCLMHMGKFIEAKFLLQAIRVSFDNGHMDESHAKSYERASQMLVELESQRVLKPIKQTEHNNESGIARGFADGHLNKMKPFGTWEKGFCFQKYFNMGHEEAYSARKRVDVSPFSGRSIPKVPFTQPRRCSRSFNNGDQIKGGLAEKAYGGFCRKLSFEPSTESENVQSLVSQNVNYYSTDSTTEMPKVTPQISEQHFQHTGGDRRKKSWDNLDGVNSETVRPLESNEERMSSLVFDCQKSATEECDLPSDSAFSADGTKVGENANLQIGWRKTCEVSSCEHKKSWADMVEEDEQALESWKSDFPQNYSGNPSKKSLFTYQTPGGFSVGSMNKERFNDENVDSNIISETPKSLNRIEKLSEKIELIDLGHGYFTQPEKTTLSMNKSVRRSVCFDQNQKPGTSNNHCISPLATTVLNFEGLGLALPEDFSPTKSTKRRNRLQVFQEITRVPGSPTHIDG